MPTKISKWKADLENMLDTLVALDLAIMRNDVETAHVDGGEFLSWNLHPTVRTENDHDTTVSDYLDQLSRRNYSCLFRDGSLIQISLHIRRNDIAWHRYGYYPCPIQTDLKPLVHSDFDIALYIDSQIKSDVRSVYQKTAFRFDYSPSDAREGHAHSHLHLNKQECRIPISCPLFPREFVTFILNSFYLGFAKRLRNYHGSSYVSDIRCITSDQEKDFHLNRRRR
jgi:hypothetical protein